MSQVERTTNDLIDAAYRFLGELGEDEPVSGTMTERGLYILNELIDQFSVSEIYVPYVEKINFTLVQGQGTYTVSNVLGQVPDITANRIVGLDYANYTVDSIVYPLIIINKSQYYNITRLNNLQTRPGFIFLSKANLESELILYPLPDRAYPCELGVKVMLDSFELNESIANVPPYFQRFLRYALTRELKGWYPSGRWDQTDEEEYSRMFKDLKACDEMDLTIRQSQIMMGSRPFYWQSIYSY